MKKRLVLILTCVVALLLVACGAKKEDNAGSDKTGAEVSASAGNSSQAGSEEKNPVEDLFMPATSSSTGACATIKVSSKIKMDDESAWVGVCPAGTDYITEKEADEVDIVYFYADYRENEDDPYVFACDFSGVEDGTYAVVVTTSDNEEIGYVVLQLEMTKKGDKLTFDYSNAKKKDRPAK